jgi:hypothetical protein
MVIAQGVVIKTKDQPAEGPVLFLRHPVIMSCLVVEFGASWGGFIVVNSDRDSGNREGLGVENALGFKVVHFISEDFADLARDDACCGMSGRHPSINWEAVDVGGGWPFGRACGLGGLGHDGLMDEIQ